MSKKPYINSKGELKLRNVKDELCDCVVTAKYKLRERCSDAPIIELAKQVASGLKPESDLNSAICKMMNATKFLNNEKTQSDVWFGY